MPSATTVTHNPARRQRQTARRTPMTREDTVDIVKNKIDAAIRDRHQEPPTLNRHIVACHYEGMVWAARYNIRTCSGIAYAEEFKAFFAIGYAMTIMTVLEETEEIMEIIPNLTKREEHLGRRVHNFFKYWPLALEQMIHITIRQFEQLTDDEVDAFLLQMIFKHMPDGPGAELDYLTDSAITPSPTSSREHSPSPIHNIYLNEPIVEIPIQETIQEPANQEPLEESTNQETPWRPHQAFTFIPDNQVPISPSEWNFNIDEFLQIVPRNDFVPDLDDSENNDRDC